MTTAEAALPATGIGPSDSGRDTPGVVTFARGIPGFERCQRFVLTVSEPVMRLEGLDSPCPCLLVVEPKRIVAGYHVELSPGDRQQLGAAADPLLWLVVLTPGADLITANLKAPIVISATHMLGLQLIADEDYPLAWPLP